MIATKTALAGCVLWAAAHLAGCALAGEGDACRIDSDCATGLVCGFDGSCETFAAVEASLDRDASPVDVVTRRDSGVDVSYDVAGCEPVMGVFEAGVAPCAEPTLKRTVTGLVLADAGHGLAQLASVANPVIADGYDNDTLAMELWVDGANAPGCASMLAWVRGPDDRNADCTAVFSDSMPFDIPGLVSTVIDGTSFDPATDVLTGLVDKQALLESMAPALRDVADQLIVVDTDTDGDEVPDRASAILTVLFTE